MRNFTTAIILLVILSFTSKAQEKVPDYIVTVNNDTLRGEVFELNNNTIKFRREGEKNKQTFQAQQLKSYFTYQSNITVKSLPNGDTHTPTFLRQLILGHVSLFELVYPNDSLQFYLELPQKNILALPKNNTSWAVLRTNLLECTSSYFENLMTQKSYLYSESYFKRIIKNYNLCVKPNEKVNEPKNVSYSSFGVLLGIDFTHWNYTFDSGENPFFNINGRLSNKFQPNIGFFYIVNLRKKLSLEFDLMYNQYSGFRDVPVNSYGTFYEPYKLTIKEKSVSLPLFLHYNTTPKEKYKLVLKAGPTFGCALRFDEIKSREFFDSDYVDTHKTVLFVGYGLGIGFERKISANKSLNIDFRYTNHRIQQVGLNNSFQLRVGVGFHN
ncbi:outer membrane beta-barrel protein [Arcicella rosea]|uniref:Outer membrane protein beta-barrel domain-containing protein n=1 Tax=Arcicella rosea TaxID=502909 RepID=A0A841ETN5_9BACT|nr:outer membrane beta-barrel protein [Arcicella rosea]MBB6005744.1 hypothetical protein [Arcicella rosea]